MTGPGRPGNEPRPAWRRLAERLIVDARGCWNFGGHRSKGYGMMSDGGHNKQAHRVAYEYLIGPIPEGLELDHLCRNRACCNPAHLEPVTRRVNVLRGARHPGGGKCANGHLFDRVWKGANGKHQNVCSICRNAKARRNRLRRQAQGANWRTKYKVPETGDPKP